MKIKDFQIVIFTLICILLNYAGKVFTSSVTLPLWLDSTGTALAAYVIGPVGGAIVGATVNIIYGMWNSASAYYAITNAALGFVIGICGRKGMMENVRGVLDTSMFAAVVSTLVSVPFNYFFYGGATGNIWGDGIFEMLKNWEVPSFFSAVVAEFFMDAVDKFVIIFGLFLLIRIFRKMSRKSPKAETLSGFFLVLGISVGMMAHPAEANVENRRYETYIQTVYSNKEGLLSGEANDIVSTDDGALWIGTYAGLYRYTGKEFQNMTAFQNVKNVNCLYVDAEGRLWIGTNDDGLSISIEEQIVNTINEDSGLPANSVRSIVQQSGGTFFVGTSDALAIVRLSGGMKVYKTIPEIQYAFSLSADQYNHVAAVTSDGELYLINDTEVVSRMEAPVTFAQFTCCYFGRDNLLYVGTDTGFLYIYEVNGENVEQKEVLPCQNRKYINALFQTDTGEIFICTDNGISYMEDDHEIIPINTGTFNSAIDNMTVDYQGNLWFCSSRLGVMKLCDSAFMELYPSTDLKETVVNSVTQWGDCLYFGTDTGLDILNKTTYETVKTDLSRRLKGTRIRNLNVDSHGNLWICTSGKGVSCVHPDGEREIYTTDAGLTGNKMRTSLELADGTMAVSGDSGISFIRGKKVIGTLGIGDGLPNAMVLCMYERSDGTLLAGTDGGGIAVIRNAQVETVYNRKNGLSSGVVLRMVKEKNSDHIFIITSNGICYMDDDGIRKLENFPYSNNYDLYDNGNDQLFVTGSAGIYVVDKQELLLAKPLHYELLNYLSGFRGIFTANAWNYVDKNGYWYISGSTGVTRVDLKNYQSMAHSYRMTLKKVEFDSNEHVLSGDKFFTVPGEVNHIGIYPEIINYSMDDPFVGYYLEGLDKEQTIVRLSELGTIPYSNLSAGDYKFHLAILDSGKKNVKEEIVYTIRKENRIYDYAWFKLLFFVELILIVVWFTGFVMRTYMQRTIEFQQRELELARKQLDMGNETIIAIARTVDAKDTNTSDHSTRVSEYSVKLARKLGYSEKEQENLRKAALLHDIGKIGIPDGILNKPARLTDEEYGIMKTHVSKGAEILKDFSLIPHVQDGALYHHERYDGRGYVSGLKGEEIPEYARIIGISDAFDAMTANRVYRKKLDFDYVLGELHRGRGTQFDPHMVDLFLELIEEGEIDPTALYKEKEAAK